MLPFAGSIEIEFRLAALTVSGVLSLTAPKVALMLVVPTDRAVVVKQILHSGAHEGATPGRTKL